MNAVFSARVASPHDAPAITRIYNEGIASRASTFETRLRSEHDIRAWFGGRFPVVVVEQEGAVIAFAATFEYRARECYAGVAEYSVYVDAAHRGRGAGRLALETLFDEARRAGLWKLVSRVFPENVASRALMRSAGLPRGRRV